MTTPEKLRERQERILRRQSWEGILLLVVGVLFAGSAWISDQRDDAAKACLTDQITKLTAAIGARSAISGQDSDATKAVILTVAGIDPVTLKTLPVGSVAERQKTVRDALRLYVQRQGAIQQSRKSTKIPTFPNGTCDS